MAEGRRWEDDAATVQMLSIVVFLKGLGTPVLFKRGGAYLTKPPRWEAARIPPLMVIFLAQIKVTIVPNLIKPAGMRARGSRYPGRAQAN